MEDSTTAVRPRAGHRTRRASHLALPTAVVVQVLGPLVLGLALSAFARNRPADTLGAVMTVAGVLMALAVVALCGLGVLAVRAAGPDGAGHPRGWTVASGLLAAALLVPSLSALLWYTRIGMEMTVALGWTVSVASLVLAAAALVVGVVTATRGAAGPGRPARVVAAVCPPAALLAPLAGLVARSVAADDLSSAARVVDAATLAGVLLAVAGLAAAVAVLRRDPGV